MSGQMRAISAFNASRKFLAMPPISVPISVRLARGQSLYVSIFQGKLMRSIAVITLFLFTVLGATASHATYTWTSHDYPSATSTSLLGIDGPNIVGTYTDSSGVHGTLYNGSTWATLDYPSATATTLTGIDGANMVGTYTDNSGTDSGTLYDDSNWAGPMFPAERSKS